MTRTILIADDVEDLRIMLRKSLDKRAGLKVVGEAATGREAIERAKSLQPDLVILDVNMPEMDGLDALPQIRAALPRGVIVMLSGFLAEDLAEVALKLGADAYLEKGMPLDDLVDEITALCRR